MILDEATEGLAPRIVEDIWRVVAQIRATGISTIIVDRNYRTVLRHTDRAVVLRRRVGWRPPRTGERVGAAGVCWACESWPAAAPPWPRARSRRVVEQVGDEDHAHRRIVPAHALAPDAAELGRAAR